MVSSWILWKECVNSDGQQFQQHQQTEQTPLHWRHNITYALRVRIPHDTIICDKVCQWLAAGRGFSPVYSYNQTDRPIKLKYCRK